MKCSYNKSRSVNKSKRRLFYLPLILTVLGGCSGPKGELFPTLTSPPRWPGAPEKTRIVYVGELLTDADLKPAKSIGDSIGEAFFGSPPETSMLTPYAVCTDGKNRLFVCDSNAQLLHVYNMDTRKYEQWKPKNEERTFSQPVGVTYDKNRIYVSDSVTSTIFVFNDSGVLLGEIGAEHLDRPCGIAIDSERDLIFVADAAVHQVVVLTSDGEEYARIGERGVEQGKFNFPTNVAVDKQGNLYVSDSLNFRVQVFDTEFQPIRKIGSKGDLPGYFSQPKGIALDGETNLYVIDAHFEAVQIFNSKGELLLAFGEEGHGPGQFWLPTGIHIDKNNRIWVADSYNRRVQVFDYIAEVQE